MKLRKIEMGPYYPGYGEGAVPGIKCEVDLQIGQYSHQSVTIELTHGQTRELVLRAVEMALEQMTIDPETIVVTGHAGEPASAADEVAHAEQHVRDMTPERRAELDADDMPL